MAPWRYASVGDKVRRASRTPLVGWDVGIQLKHREKARASLLPNQHEICVGYVGAPTLKLHLLHEPMLH